MFKWDRLLRKNKLTKGINNIRDLSDDYDRDTFSETREPKEEITPANDEYEIVEMEILPTKIICPDCGGITLEGLEFCDKCGGELYAI